MKRRFFILLTTITILLLFGAVSANAEIVKSGSCGDNVTYTIDDEGTLTISGTGMMYNYSSVSNYSPFYNDSNIKTVVIRNGVTSIGEYTFLNCNSMNSITIPNTITSIESGAFLQCSGLTSITFPNSITSIGGDAFYNCSGLTSVTISESVTSIGYGAFTDCSNLTNINVSEDNRYYSSFDGNLYNKNKTELIQYAIGKTDESFEFLDDVTSIGYGAFYGCSNLISITIPNKITSIGDYAFYNCGGLTSVTMPTVITSIGTCTFSECSSLMSITIPDSVKSIGWCAFMWCDSLTSVTIPNSVTNIEYGAFYDCDKIKNIYYSGSEKEWKAIDIGYCNDALGNTQIVYNCAKSTQITTVEVAKSEENYTWRFEINVGQTYSYSKVYTAIYGSDGKMTKIISVPLKTEGNTTVTADKSPNDKEAKIFVWTNKSQPITEMASVNL